MKRYKIYRLESGCEWFVTFRGGIVIENTHSNSHWMLGWGWRELVNWCNSRKFTIKPV